MPFFVAGNKNYIDPILPMVFTLPQFGVFLACLKSPDLHMEMKCCELTQKHFSENLLLKLGDGKGFVKICLVKKRHVGEGGELECMLDDAIGTGSTV